MTKAPLVWICVALALPALAVADTAAPWYNPTVPPAFPASKDEQALLDMLNRARRAKGLPDLRWDPALGGVCRRHTDDMVRNRYFEYESPRLGSMHYRVHRAGVSAAMLRFVIYQLASLGHVLEELAKIEHPFHLEPDTHIGIGIHRQFFPRRYTITIVSVRRVSVLEPFPMTPRAGSAHRLAGRFTSGVREPRLAVTLPNGKVSSIPVRVEAGGRFAAAVRFDLGPGKYTVQLAGKNRSGPVVADAMHVYVGVPYPKPSSSGGTGPAAEEDPEAVMYRALNADRARYNLKALRLDSRLSALARSHSRDMAVNHFFAHRSPRTGELADRVRSAGLTFRKFAENIAIADSGASAQKNLMNSPQHRRNILTPDFEMVGIGIARDRDGILYATQVFALDFRVIDVRAAAGDLRRALNAARAGRGVAAMKSDPQLDLVAVANSRAMVKADTTTTKGAKAYLDAGRIRFQYAQVLVLISDEAPSGAAFEKAMSAEFTHVGIGMIQADSRKHGPRRLWTTLLLIKR